MRSLGCLVVALVVLGVALFFADQAVTATAERRTAHTVAQALDAETEINFEGWPVAGRMLLGTIPTARVSAVDVPLENGGNLDELVVELTDVEVDVSNLSGSGEEPRLPEARLGTFDASLNERTVTTLLGLPGGIAQASLGNDEVTISAAGLEVAADVEARDGDVVVSLKGPIAQIIGGAEFPIDLSNQPGAPAVEEVEINDGVMSLRGTLEDV